MALATLGAVIALAIRLWRGAHEDRRAAAWLLALLVVQVASGLSNVLLDWPLLAALLHTAGAAALVAVLTSLALRRQAPRAAARALAEATWQPHRS